MYLSNLLCKAECITEHKDCLFLNTRSCAVRSAFVTGIITRRKISKWRYRKNHGHGLNQTSPLQDYFGLLSVYLKTGFKCWYCGCDMQFLIGNNAGGDAYTFDHRVDLAMGGENRIDNMVICCYDCNQKKSQKDVVR